MADHTITHTNTQGKPQTDIAFYIQKKQSIKDIIKDYFKIYFWTSLRTTDNIKCSTSAIIKDNIMDNIKDNIMENFRDILKVYFEENLKHNKDDINIKDLLISLGQQQG